MTSNILTEVVTDSSVTRRCLSGLPEKSHQNILSPSSLDLLNVGTMLERCNIFTNRVKPRGNTI